MHTINPLVWIRGHRQAGRLAAVTIMIGGLIWAGMLGLQSMRVNESGSSVASSSETTPKGLSTEQWQGIQEAHDTWKRSVRQDGDGWKAENPGQGLTASFDRRGMEVRPESGGWRWGLELTSYGVGATQTAIAGQASSVRTETERVTYDWDANLEEWYQNDARGLEHGYTIRRRPAGATASDPLALQLKVRGGLRPIGPVEGRNLAFGREPGSALLRYSNLKVFDAEGKELAARFEADGEEAFRIVVEDQGATYPVTIDPLISQQAYLKANNAAADDRFGTSVSVSGDTVVVGAWGEDSNATGVNGDGSNNSASASGAAYVFVRSGTTWSQQAYLKASNTEAIDQFGRSVAISGDTVVVGAWLEDSNATSVGGNQGNDASGTNWNSGAAYVFVRSGTTWSQQAYLKASNTNGGDTFGLTVAIAGDTVVVGAHQEDSNATGVNGNATDNSALDSGAAYVFVRSGTAWSQEAYLKASNTGAGDQFGLSVAISGDTVVVGANYEDSNATTVNGDETSNSASGSGAAYVFERSGTTWSQQAYLKANNAETGDEFGFSVAISGNSVMVGAILEDSNATGVNGAGTNNSASNSGAAYVFERSGVTWSQQAYLKASNADADDQFGFAVAISGNILVVGGYWEDSNSTGVDGDGTNNTMSGSGAAYVFARSGVTWSQQAYLKASNTGPDDNFGETVSVSGGTVVVGAWFEDSNAITINGDQSNNSAGNAGAAYIFFAPSPTITAATGVSQTIGSGTSNSTIATVSDSNVSASNLTVTLTSANPTGGVTISNIVNTNGTITADIVASCAATAGTASFTMQVSNGLITTSATLNVTVVANPAPTLTYSASSVTTGAATTINPATGPTDNGSVSTVAVQSQGTYTGTISVNSSGVVSISNAAPAGTHTITIRATDNCGTTTDATTSLTVSSSGGGGGAIVADNPIVSGSGEVVTPGSPVMITQKLNNTSPSPTSTTYVATLPAGFSAISCTAPTGSCVIATVPLMSPGDGGNGLRRRNSLTATTTTQTFTWTGTVPGNGSVTLTYLVQVSPLATGGSQYCVTTNVNGTPGATTCLATAAAAGPGIPSVQSLAQAESKKPGSVLIYNIYTSGLNTNANDSRMTITNVNPTRRVYVHLFFVDGASCAVADMTITLTQNQTKSFMVSDMDPGVTGYLIAVATNEDGCPTTQNDLIGESLVKFESGHRAALPALGVVGLGVGVQTCDQNSTTATLNFDGLSYDTLPRTLAISSLSSIANGNSTLLVVNRIGGDLGVGAGRLGSLFGLLYDDMEVAQSFTLGGNVCQLRGVLGNNFPRTAPRYTAVIPAGRSGWMKFWGSEEQAITGAVMQEGQFSGGHNLHHLTTTSTASLTIPVFPNQ